jgi:hypothetical protein
VCCSASLHLRLFFFPYVGLCCRLYSDIQRIGFCSEQLGAARFLPESHITTALALGLSAQIYYVDCLQVKVGVVPEILD